MDPNQDEKRTGGAVIDGQQPQQFSGSGSGSSRRDGGGATGKDLNECMGTWDSSTHMSKELWRTTCESR